MNVLFVSQCSKRALTQTRRILDQFAERKGERSWQTPITQAGLDTVRKLLRTTARKNTAIACHWIRARDHTELLWIVGDASQFNMQGTTPTNTTSHNVLRSADESTWHHLPLLTALTALAALIHDLGKATQAFQDRLCDARLREVNRYRHEWVSVRLFQSFVGPDASSDADWLERLTHCAHAGQDEAAFEALWLDHSAGRLIRDGLDTDQSNAAAFAPRNPFRALPPLAQCVAWLVLTHHRLPCKPVRYGRGHAEQAQEDGERTWRPFGAPPSFVNRDDLRDLLSQIHADWNQPREHADTSRIRPYWSFPQGLPVGRKVWRKQAARYALKIAQLHSLSGFHASKWLADPFLMHIARMCLMLADHHYSRLSHDPQGAPSAERKPYLQIGAKLHANTCFTVRGERVLNQTLDEHLLGVQAQANLITHSLPKLARCLPALLNHRGLKKRSAAPQFHWQNKAADLATSLRHQAQAQGGFIINMASTGCGKTLGNARIMNALADPLLGMRCAFAIGLRTLTLQTGRSFQHDLGLNDEQLAIKVGGAASKALFEYHELKAQETGSASSLGLLDEGGQVLFEGDDRHPLLQRLSDDPQVRSLLAAPLLVCTVDHLTPATESLRGGHQITPMLRLLTGDLVLDEPDDFDMSDLPALTRLVHWAGLLGSRVLLSSATLPPHLVEGLFLAYRSGREFYQRHRSERPHEPVHICCLWVDEFHQAADSCADRSAFKQQHAAFVHKRVAQLAKAHVRRIARIEPLPAEWAALTRGDRHQAFAERALQCAIQLHQQRQNHNVDPVSGQRVSFGLIRMANIEPLCDVALALFQARSMPPGVRVHLCVYHSQFPLLTRSVIEQQLDTVLNRRCADSAPDPIFRQPRIRALIDAHAEQDHLFIVLGSPVTEVGRDHDYDWAVVEPSSMRSLIQLAGRIRRHRGQEVSAANMVLLDSNLRALQLAGANLQMQAAFCKPGFELNSITATTTDAAQHFHFSTHRLTDLLARHAKGQSQWPVDARPRIAAHEDAFNPRTNLADLEHARMHDALLPRPAHSALTTPVDRDASLAWYEANDAQPQCLWLTGLLPQFQRFRADSMRRVDVVHLPDADDDDAALLLHRVVDRPGTGEALFVPVESSLLSRVPDALLVPTPLHPVQPWMRVDLKAELTALAEHKRLSLYQCAQRYATASLPDAAQGWRWHEVLGFSRN